MASLYKEKRGEVTSYRVQWLEKNRRRSIRLGTINETAAEQFCVHIEEILEARNHGRSLGLETTRWLRRLGDDLHSRLADAKLTERRHQTRLGDLIDSVIASKKNWKPSTREKHEIVGKHLTDVFGRDRDLRKISQGDAERWREAMLEKLARSTVSKMVKQARFFFKRAIADNLIEENPFDGVRAGSEVNSERLKFISQEIVQRCIDAAPDSQWRTIIALARYGGCRTPSETLRLRWSDINWERGRFMVRSVKTEHHEGKATRFTPLFPELREVLEEAFELAPEGEDRVIYRYRETERNLRTEMGRIIDRAGEERWPRVFQNLRASRETELCRQYPLHVVAAWLGNTPKVAQKHYLDVTEEDFQRAAACGQDSVPTKKQAEGVQSDGDSTDEASENEGLLGAPVGAVDGERVQKRCSNRQQRNAKSLDKPGFCEALPSDATHCKGNSSLCVTFFVSKPQSSLAVKFRDSNGLRVTRPFRSRADRV